MAAGSNAGAAAETALYRSEEKIHAREVDGTFARLRKIAVFVLLGIFYGLPWITWQGRQAILFDLPARKFHLFDLTLWPQDFIFLALLLIIAALSLFFFTALAGRLWCGFACPQTVWTEVFVWMEQWTEGKYSQRKKLDKAPWTTEKFLRKGSKQFLWITFALFTGLTFVGYFTPIRELLVSSATFSLGPWETFWVLFYGFATYGNAGYMREQVCKYMCPYARFQSAMFDRDTLIITYDADRGEPRGSRRRGVDPQEVGLGDCIDCTMCVQVCPTGIDIREGLQYECIACAACIDACDDVMERMGYPKKLIKYSTQHAMDGETTRVVRPRVIVYAVLLTILMGAFVYALSQRSALTVDVIRDRNALYREVGDGFIENSYQLKLINKTDRAHSYDIGVAGIEGASVEVPNGDIRIPSGEVLGVPVIVRAPREAVRGVSEVTFTLQAEDDATITQSRETKFVAPVGR
ncbi:cytochrome c oxidase accessory protein CcoG [Lentisalinibacter orientalis]|uniref:cytochrome c oxidase accessory protein CcoG n=1 Tax=Lentisalinibacter orientalis TaxID=2992241 RepID=UPI00386FA45A